MRKLLVILLLLFPVHAWSDEIDCNGQFEFLAGVEKFCKACGENHPVCIDLRHEEKQVSILAPI